MNDVILAKKKYFYNSELYKQVFSYERKKNLKKLLICLFLIILSIFFVFLIAKFFRTEDILLCLVVIVPVVVTPIFAFLASLYYLYKYVSNLTCKSIFSDICYILTEDNKFLSVKFFNYYGPTRTHRYNRSSVINLVSMFLLNNSIKSKYEKRKNDMSQELNINELISGVEIINIYNITDTEDCLELDCDYRNLLTDEIIHHSKINVYKFFDNFAEIKTILQGLLYNSYKTNL